MGTPPRRTCVVVVLRRVLDRVAEVRLRVVKEGPIDEIPDVTGPATIGISTSSYVKDNRRKGDAPRIVRRPEGLDV